MNLLDQREPLAPAASLLVKVASILVHFDEFHGPYGHALDFFELTRLLEDPEVLDWLAEMTLRGLAPVQRRIGHPRHRRKHESVKRSAKHPKRRI